MFRISVPLAEFYEQCLDAAKRSGYSVAVCLIAREADSPEIYDELSRYWTSFHDLTGPNVLFLFASDSVKHQIASEVYHANQPAVLFSEAMAVTNPTKLRISKQIPRERLIELGMFSPVLETENHLRSSQTLQISQLRRRLLLSENDVPALHFTFLDSGEKLCFSIGQFSGFSAYRFLKDLMSDWHPIFTQLKHLQYEIDKLRASVPQRATQAFEAELRAIKLERELHHEGDLEPIYDRLIAILSHQISHVERKEYYGLLEQAKRQSAGFSRSREYRSLQRALDLALTSSYYQQETVRIRSQIEQNSKVLGEQQRLIATILAKHIEELGTRPAPSQGVLQMTSVLFLAADPSNESRLRLGAEFREIQEQLALSEDRRVRLALPQLSLRPKDITKALLGEKPRIVHFSGHGTPDGALCFENDVGQRHLVHPDALAALFRQFTSQVSCVVLNACYSENQARAIAEHIDYVIGMNQSIGDRAAITFSLGFYQALGAGRTIEDAFELGRVQLQLENIPQHLTPVLIRKGSSQL